MKILFILLMVTISLAACSPAQTVDPAPGVLEPQEEITVIPTSQVLLQPGMPAWEQSAGSLTARIFSTADTTVKEVSFLIQGQANEEVVVTINDAIFTNAADSIFSFPFSLDEGPNLIEIVMSDYSGNEVSFSLTVTYEP